MSETDTDTDTDEQAQSKYRDAAELLDAATMFEGRMVQSNHAVDLNPKLMAHIGAADNILDVRIHTDDESFEVHDVVFHEDGRCRFTIPKRKRKLYGVEHGDVIDVEIINVHRDRSGGSDAE